LNSAIREVLYSRNEENKKNIADSFSASAVSYDQFASLQQQAGKELIDFILSSHLDIEATGNTLIDVGCGTGFFTQPLIKAFNVKKYLGIDIAQGMLDVAKHNNASLEQSTELYWHCEDAESLSLSDQSVDIIFANFSLQWCDNLSALMKSFHRVLKPNGLCCFTSLGSDSLHELRESWSVVDNFKHVNHFSDTADWSKAITQQGFSIINSYRSEPISYYSSVRELLHSLKAIGANTVLGHRQKGLMGKTHFQNFIAAYEQYRQPQGLPVTYHIDGWVIQK